MENDEKTFKELIHRQHDLIWRVCSSYRLSPAWTIEDAFHEVLCDLWRGLPDFDGRSAERTWVFRVATNTMISLVRKAGNQPTTPPPEHHEPSYRDEGYNDLVGMIDALGEPDSTIVRAHVQGFSHAETAKSLGLSRAAVAMRLSRALKKIRKQYNQ